MHTMWNWLTRPSILNAIEHILNQAIADTPAAQQSLSTVSDQIFALTLTSANITICVCAQRNGITLTAQNPEKPNLRISGSALSLAKLALADDKQSVIETEPLVIEGSTNSLYAWQKVFKNIHVQWEMQLAQRIGPIPAKLIITPLRHIRMQAQNSLAELPNNLHHSLVWHQLAVPNKELDDMGNASHDLRTQVEKLQQRLKTLP